MTQKLILPLNKTLLGVGYKAAAYPQFTQDNNMGRLIHYGHDYRLSSGSDTRIWGSGKGRVIDCGEDAVVGFYVIVRYEDVIGANRKAYKVLTFRYFHLEKGSIKVSKGQSITKDTVIATMGNTGKYSTGVHLHLEIDTDENENYARWSPTISLNPGAGSSAIKGGIDTTINPGEILFIKPSSPDYQEFVLDSDTHYKGESWFNTSDNIIQTV